MIIMGHSSRMVKRILFFLYFDKVILNKLPNIRKTTERNYFYFNEGGKGIKLWLNVLPIFR